MRGSRGLALLLCLAGAVLLLVGAGATWATQVVAGVAPLPDTTVRASGADLVPGLRVLGVVGLAGVPALLAVRRLGRVLVGLLLLLAGTATALLVGRVLLDFATQVLLATAPVGSAAYVPLAEAPAAPAPTAPAYGALLGGVLLAVAGLLAVVRGRTWPVLGARFDAPQARAVEAPTSTSTWEALDRGEDPTA